ncbi:gluconate 2-dehydrogenase alpha chain, partial [Jeotgalicoccus aerolatus]
MVNRFLPYVFEVESMTEEKYGGEKLEKDKGYHWQNWGITYDELEPYYTKIEKTMGVSGEDKGTNPFWGERSEDFPTPPLLKTPILKLWVFGLSCRNSSNIFMILTILNRIIVWKIYS